MGNMRKITILALILLATLLLRIEKKEPTPAFKITNVDVKTTTTNATFKWTTTVGTKLTFEYYPEENFTHWGIKGIDRHGSSYNFNHSVTLWELKPNTTYLFRITAKDIDKNPEYYESNFTTN